MQNLRDLVRNEVGEHIKGYGSIVREERHFCAVLFHCMLQDPEGMQRFLDKCEVDSKHREVRGVFVEYAMVRDLWNTLNKRGTTTVERNKWKREWIINVLCREPSESDSHAHKVDLGSLDVAGFNKLFVAGNVSTKFIQSPSRWGIRAICNSGGTIGAELLKRACMLKWAFNSKPDIVVELTNDTVVCIEAKVESKEGKYASAKRDKEALCDALKGQNFDNWISESAKQVIVQRHVMKDILGYPSVREIFLDNITEDDPKVGLLSWKTAFSCFSHTSNPTVAVAIDRLEKLSR